MRKRNLREHFSKLMKPRIAILAIFAVALILAIALAGTSQRDIAPFNKFAESYNAYVAIDFRIQDLKALKRMRADWHALAKSQGWPEEKCREQ